MTALRRQDGTTLVEVLVTAALGVVVLLALLMVTDLVTSQSASQRRGTAAEEAARTTLARFVRVARDAPPNPGTTTPIVVAAPHDLVIATAGSTPTWTRYCVGAPDGGATATDPGVLRVGTLTGSWVDPGAGCPAVGSGGWSYVTGMTGLRSPDTLFAYDVQQAIAGGRYDPTKVGAITVTLTLDAGGGRTTSLTSAVTPRNRS